MTTQSTYILSLEANDIYCHMNRGSEIKFNYCGMIPYSLELMKLKKQKEFTTFTVKHSEKEFSNDLINVKFNQKVKSDKELINILRKKINKLNKEMDEIEDNSAAEKIKSYICKIEDYILVLEREKDCEKWKGLSNDKLRENLYLNGFTITDKNGKQTKYCVYKRSSSKSRQGQCLFIKESLHEEMINWSRMYLPFKENMKVDLAGLLSYESLVGSSVESTIKINPKNILIVDDMESEFIKLANVIRKGKDDYLESATEEAKFSNSLFDGESLLEAKYFEEGVSMKLLRNHFFKSAAFSCNIQQFLKDHCPEDVQYDNWKIKNMFNEQIFAKDIELIITPSSLKILKFAHVLDDKGELSPFKQKKQIFHYWKKMVRKDKNIFGVCKSEKKSKRGVDEEGNVLQQLSYQMINSIPMNKSDMEILTQWENDYIKRLKNDDEFFIQYLRENSNNMNSFEMLADIYGVNKNIINTEMFRMFRSREISNYANRVKGGKVRLVADYAILLGNPIEFLFHSIGRLKKNLTIDGDVKVLQGNEVFTKLFPVNNEYLGFRNPHTFAGNILIMNNTYNEMIDTYLNLSNNIVVVNAIGFELPSILSGADYDSDSMLIVNSEHLLGICKKFIHTENENYKNDYNVCLKNIKSDTNDYRLNSSDMAKIDNKLSLSQKYIGSVVNNGQFALSAYWNQIKKGKSKEELNEFSNKISISAILSEISIDLAKKSFDLNIKKEIEHINEFSKQYSEMKDENVKFPFFWKYVKNTKKNKTKVDNKKLSFYYCPMDLLQGVINTEYAEDRPNIDFISLLQDGNFKKSNYKQEDKIWEYVEKFDNRIKNIYADSHLDEEEQIIKLDNAIKLFSYSMKKFIVNKDTMYALLVHMSKNTDKPSIKLLKLLHETQKETFLAAFKNE